jgi:hypothetical protein
MKLSHWLSKVFSMRSILFLLLLTCINPSYAITEAEEIAQLQILSEQGDATAQYQLAQRYDYGFGLSYSPEIARQLYEKAAAQGHVEAQFLLGVIYQSNTKLAGSTAIAKKWYQQAAAQGHKGAQRNLDALKAKDNRQ